jgi:arylsulfatase A-like enzyme
MALDFLRSNAKSQASGGPPFALVMSWGPPHTPFIAPQEFEAMYDPARIALRPNVQMRDDWIRLGDNGSYKGPYTDPEMVLKHFIARYYAMVSNLDNNFGRLLKGLDDLNLAENTVVVFTSDHGDMLGSHGQLHKGQPWDESVRVPLLIRFPGVIPPRLESGAPFNTPDILPTLLGLMRLSVPKGVEGEDLSAILRGEDVKEPSSCFLLCPCAATTWGGHWKDLAFGGRGIPPGFMRPYRGIRTRTHTYVRDRMGPWLLYDNEKDPHQLTDLVETQGRAAVPPELERELNDWLERTGDFFGDNAEYERYVDLTTGLALQPRTLRRE